MLKIYDMIQRLWSLLTVTPLLVIMTAEISGVSHL